MKELKDLLVEAKVANALIVDDAYDAVPTATDLEAEADEWTHFFDDLSGPERAALVASFPDYRNMSGEQMRASNLFVEALWNNRAAISPRLLDPLFARYETDTALDLEHLNSLKSQLEELGLKCQTVGREFEEQVAKVDLVFIDLFLTSAQRPQDIELSINGLARAISKRKASPPLVVLMSRSTRLTERRGEFKEKTRLFESAFRIIRKEDLQDPGALTRTVRRLASHYADSTKLAAFVDAWEESLAKAGERTTALIRKLGLAEIAQIHHLLLSTEGEPTGSYLVDVFDKVLQYEIEAEVSIISTAKALNDLKGEEYPPPFVPGANDLLELVHHSLFHNRARLALPGSSDSILAFGDVLRRKAAPAKQNGNADGQLLEDFGVDDVLLALTPACDLQRTGVKRVLLLKGSLRELTAADWTYKDEAKTPVCDLADGTRKWIKWDLKHIETLSHGQLGQMLNGEQADFEVIARLNESHALELQQRLLSSMGRIGLVAPMPATFSLIVEAYLPDTQGALVRLDIPGLNDGGVCYVGRSAEGKPVERLSLTEGACDAIAQILETKDLETVHERSRDLIKAVIASGELLEALEKGVALPAAKSEGFKDITAVDGKVVGLLRRARLDANNGRLTGKHLVKAGIVLHVFDPNEGGQGAMEEIEIAVAPEVAAPEEKGLGHAEARRVAPPNPEAGHD